MRKFTKATLALVVILLATTSCANFKELAEENINVTPELLEANGGKIDATINGTFPEGYFPAKGTLTVTPVLKYNGQEVLGEPFSFQGEKVEGNNTVVPKDGGTFSQDVSFDYTGDEMRTADLYLRAQGQIGNKTHDIPDFKVADGVITTSELAQGSEASTAIGEDQFMRITQETEEADIKFLIQQAVVRSSETKKTEVKDLLTYAKEANKEENKTVKNISVSAYASPDGAYSLNESLAQKRGEATDKYLARIMKKAEVNAEVLNSTTAEDWDGFQAALANSSIEDKDLILRVLSMYSDPEVREREIKNLSAAYEDLAKNVLPELRRSQVAVNVEVVGKTDQEIMNLAKSSPSELNVEELLYAATLTDDKATQAAIYKEAANLYPQDWRTANNYGNVLFEEGNVSEAESMFEKAASLSNSPEVMNNLAAVKLANGDVEAAKEMLGKAGNVEAAQENLGLVALSEGNYSQAASQLADNNTNNAVVAKILAKDYTGAKNALEAQADKDAMSYYLAAIVGARTDNPQEIATNLTKSISMDSKYAEMAKTDAEFSQYIDNPVVSSLLK